MNWSWLPNPDGGLDTRKEGEESFSWSLNFLPLDTCQYAVKNDNTLKDKEGR